MKDYDLTAWLDEECDTGEQELVEQELSQNPERIADVAALIREQLLMAETLIEEFARLGSECPECERAEPFIEILPNEEIFTAYIDGQLSAAESLEVERQLASDPGFKKELAEIFDDEPCQAAPPMIKFSAARTRTPILANLHLLGTSWLKIAAMFAILAAGTWFLSRQYLTSPGGNTPQTAAVELNASLAEIQGEVAVLRNTKRLRPDRAFLLRSSDTIVTDSGQTTVRYEDGTTFQILSHSEAKFSDKEGAKRIMLTQGLASADVAKQAAGKALVVRTPQMEVTVLGTAFSLEATQSQTMLEMKEGTVSIYHLKSGQTTKASAGQSLSAGSDSFTKTSTSAQVVSFSLIDAKTKKPVPEYDPIAPNAIIPLSLIKSRPLTIEINTTPKIMSEVMIDLNGPPGFDSVKSIEKHYPYLVTNNTKYSHVDKTSYQPLHNLIAGDYSITATAKTSDQRSHSLTLAFKIQP